MQTVIGRLTADAQIAETPTGKKVVHFTIAHNRRFKAKGQEEIKQITTYYNGSYWIGTAIAPYLKKGTLIQADGYIGTSAWQNRKGEPMASLTLHVNAIDLLTSPTAANPATPAMVSASGTAADDLPF